MKSESTETISGNLPIKERKELAKLLYTRGIVQQQNELAERVKVSKVTINKWVNDGKWDDERRSLLTVRFEQLARLYRMLERKISTLEAGEKQDPPIPISTKDTDIIVKLTGAIKQLEVEVSVADIIEVFQKFNEWSRSQGGALLETIKEIGMLQDGFIKSRL